MGESFTAKSSIVEGSRRAVLQNWLQNFTVPEFSPHRWLLGGHLQTVVPPRLWKTEGPHQVHASRHDILLDDGDMMRIHDDRPESWTPDHGCVLLLHGICGCHRASYMLRFHQRLNAQSIRTFRLDMRGCGDSASTCRSITHAGRSDDVMTAIRWIASTHPNAIIGVAGVSLGGNQLLRLAGRMGAGLESDDAWSQVGPLLAIAPPVDLQACSDRMQAWQLRLYNRYFISHLLKRSGKPLRQRTDYQDAIAEGRCKTLRQFDRQFTARLAGFADERAYYADSSALPLISSIRTPTMIVAAADDPLVPVSSFQNQDWSDNRSLRLCIQPTGGHHGFLQAKRCSWSDELVECYFTESFERVRV